MAAGIARRLLVKYSVRRDWLPSGQIIMHAAIRNADFENWKITQSRLAKKSFMVSPPAGSMRRCLDGSVPATEAIALA